MVAPQVQWRGGSAWVDCSAPILEKQLDATYTHKTLEACLADMIATEHSDPEMHELIVSMAREIEKIKDRELSGVWTTTMRALHLYREPNIAQHTDRSDVDLTRLQFGDRSMTLYLVEPSVEDVALYHPVYRVILEMIFRIGTTHPGRPHPLLNAVLLEVDPQERVVVIEDVEELQLTTPNGVRFLTVDGMVDLRALVRKALRLQIDRLVVGETRGPEALDIIKGWNTGHSGMCTIHADSTLGALRRLEMLAQEAVAVVPRELIGDTIQAVCVIGSVTGGRNPRVVRLDAIRGWVNGAYVITPLGAGEGDA